MKGASKIRKILSLFVLFTFIFQQAGFAQSIGQLQMSRYIAQPNASGPENFRPLHLRYFSYNPLTDNFQVLLDKGTLKEIKDSQIKEQSQELLRYFLIGITLPDENFWVNLRPDSENQIIDPELARTDLGKILLEADLQLKKDLASFISPKTPEGRDYWNSLRTKATQIFGSENVTIPTLTRPWIVPGEVIIRETQNSAYVYKATLKVMLEQDHLKNSSDYNFNDPKLKQLNDYSSQLIRDKILPKLTKKVNSSANYASLKQVFYSLILARWFKNKFAGKTGLYSSLINTRNLNGLTSKTAWSKTTYFKEYQKSFTGGEYNVKGQLGSAQGSSIRTYFTGGITFRDELRIPRQRDNGSPLGTFIGSSPIITSALGIGLVPLSASLNGQLLPDLKASMMDVQAGSVSSSPVTAADRNKRDSLVAQATTQIGGVNTLLDQFVTLAHTVIDNHLKLDVASLDRVEGTNFPTFDGDSERQIVHNLASNERSMVELMKGPLSQKVDELIGTARELRKLDVRAAEKLDEKLETLRQQMETRLTDESRSAADPATPDYSVKFRNPKYGTYYTALARYLSSAGSSSSPLTPVPSREPLVNSMIARPTYDSRGASTIELDVTLTKGGFTYTGSARIPAGASTGMREVWINPDFVKTTNEIVIPRLYKAIQAGQVDITSQKSLADWLKALDRDLGGSVRLERLGGNVVLAVCWAFADAVAKQKQIPLYRYWQQEYGQGSPAYSPEATYNILNAGAHGSATTKVDTQETQFAFLRQLNAAQQNALAVAVNNAMKKYLKTKGLVTTNGDEGGYSPEATSNMQYVRYLVEAVNSIANGPLWGKDIAIAFDFASTGFFKDGFYYLQGESEPIDLLKDLGTAGQAYFKKLVEQKILNSTTIGEKVIGVQHNDKWIPDAPGIKLTGREWLAYVQYMMLRIPAWSLEDVCAENDWSSIREMTRLLEEDRDFYDARRLEHQATGFYDGRRVWHLGDDSITSNPDYAILALEGSENTEYFTRVNEESIRVNRNRVLINLKELGANYKDGKYIIEPHTLNAFLLKFNQIGTPDDTFAAAEQALKRGALVSFSHRSGSARDWQFIHGAYVAVTFKHNVSSNPNLLPELKNILPRVNIKAGNATRERMLVYHTTRELVERSLGLIEEQPITLEDVADTSKDKAATSSPIRKPFVGGNWKMAVTNEADAVKLLEQVAAQIGKNVDVETVIAPSSVHIPMVSQALKRLVAEGKVSEGAIQIAAQNMYSEEKGAFTGGTSAAQLKGYGVTHVILGHSEVRRNSKQELTGESSQNVNRKVKTAIQYRLTPIVCVGESDAERTAGREIEIVKQMVRDSLTGISSQDAEKVVVAYEPVWAIGTNKSATPEQAEQMHDIIRRTLIVMFGEETAAKIRILYGGSVTADNIAGFRMQPNIDGALVGGASLKVDNFSGIVKTVASTLASSPIASSPVVVTTPGAGDVGGIDFRLIPKITQPMGSFSGLNLSLPKLSNAGNVNLDQELNQIQKMLTAGITPSGNRLKEYVAACYQKGELKAHLDGIVTFLVGMCRLEEEKGTETTKELKEVMLILDSTG